MYNLVEIDGNRIHDWKSFHDVFAETMGFPDFYGRNMNAWVDCMSDVDDPSCGMTAIHAPKDGVLVLVLQHASGLATRCPQIYDALVDGIAFVNHRRLEVDEGPVLALAYSRTDT